MAKKRTTKKTKREERAAKIAKTVAILANKISDCLSIKVNGESFLKPDEQNCSRANAIEIRVREGLLTPDGIRTREGYFKCFITDPSVHLGPTMKLIFEKLTAKFVEKDGDGLHEYYRITLPEECKK